MTHVSGDHGTKGPRSQVNVSDEFNAHIGAKVKKGLVLHLALSMSVVSSVFVCMSLMSVVHNAMCTDCVDPAIN